MACMKQCNNCTDKGLLVSLDVTEEAKTAVALVQSQSVDKTLLQCIAVFREPKSAGARKEGLNRNLGFGAEELERLLFDQLVYRGVLVEKAVRKNGHTHYLVKAGSSPSTN